MSLEVTNLTLFTYCQSSQLVAWYDFAKANVHKELCGLHGNHAKIIWNVKKWVYNVDQNLIEQIHGHSSENLKSRQFWSLVNSAFKSLKHHQTQGQWFLGMGLPQSKSPKIPLLIECENGVTTNVPEGKWFFIADSASCQISIWRTQTLVYELLDMFWTILECEKFSSTEEITPSL